MKVSLSNIFPKSAPALKLFTTGATVGPLVDSLHNQCLLRYDKAPIDIAWNNALFSALNGGSTAARSAITMLENDAASYILRTSWYIPPLLGVAYLVLGAILPRCMSLLLEMINASGGKSPAPTPMTKGTTAKISPDTGTLQTKAILAVTSTALIIKLSEFLEVNPSFAESLSTGVGGTSEINLFLMIAAALS